jgi:hypothetical protein
VLLIAHKRFFNLFDRQLILLCQFLN